MIELLKEKLAGKSVALLGFGREGQSSWKIIRKVLPEQIFFICDADESVRTHELLANDRFVEFQLGPGYLHDLQRFDLILRSPGIPLYMLKPSVPASKITSQTDLFLQAYSGQVIGITGTKGKSTTSSLLFHILRLSGTDVLLLGNIGRPALNYLDEISPSTLVVYELSSHQLEYIQKAPHISVLLNLYQEHLDAYSSYMDYQLAKMNIARYQCQDDFFIYNADDPLISAHLLEKKIPGIPVPFSQEDDLSNGSFIQEDHVIFSRDGNPSRIFDTRWKTKLKGEHNIRNIMAVISVCKILGIENDRIIDGITTFKGLEHRLEFAGKFHGIEFYDDSIATIPEACIEAVKAIQNVDTIVLGGFDRGIDYTGLAEFLCSSGIRNFIFTGNAGKRIMEEMEKSGAEGKNLFPISKFDAFLGIALEHTLPGSVCLLSPAAASYDEFRNFEFRGKRFKELVNGQ